MKESSEEHPEAEVTGHINLGPQYCQYCKKAIPSPREFRDADHLRIFFMTGACQQCQDGYEESLNTPTVKDVEKYLGG